MKKGKLIAVMVVFLVMNASCQSRNQDSSRAPQTINFVGYIQKGPFIQGSEVRVQEMDDALERTGNIFFTNTNTDAGSFGLTANISAKYVDIAANGFYFNEVSESISSSPITLKALESAGTDTVQRININILTTLEYERIKHLVTVEGKAFDTARAQAEKEVLQIFHIGYDNLATFDKMDIANSEDCDAILIAVSSILQGNNTEGQLSELVNKISDDISTDGTLDGLQHVDKIRKNSTNLDLAGIRTHLMDRYASLGVVIDVPAFEGFIDYDGNGTIDRDQAPQFNPPPGVYNHDITVDLSTTDGGTIHFTTDGSDPSSTSPVYIAPISVAGQGTSITIKVYAEKDTIADSKIVSATYTIKYLVTQAPTFTTSSPFVTPSSYEPSYYEDDIMVSLYSANGGTIYYTTYTYTTGATIPTVSSNVYTAPIPIQGDGTVVIIDAFAEKDGLLRSSVVRNVFEIHYAEAQAPSFNLLAGTYTADISVTLLADGNIHYTTDGREPSIDSPVYTGPIPVTGQGTGMTVKAFSAPQSHKKPSRIVESFYRIDSAYRPDEHISNLSVSDYKAHLVGTWVGHVNDYNVEITINGDMSYIARTLTPSPSTLVNGQMSWLPPFGKVNWKSDGVLTIYDLDANGQAQGDMIIYIMDWPPAKNISPVKSITLKNNFNNLSFILWRGDICIYWTADPSQAVDGNACGDVYPCAYSCPTPEGPYSYTFARKN